MTIKRYFILGILAIFLLLAVSQTLLVLHFKSQVSADITEQSKVITKQLIGKAREDINQIIHKLDSDIPKVVILSDKVTISNTLERPPEPPQPQDNSKVPEPSKPPIPTQPVKPVVTIKAESLKDEVNSVFFHFEDDKSIRKIISTEHNSHTQSHSVERFTSLILWSIALSTLIAVGLMLYFVHRLTQPITALKQGFKDLSDGNLGTQLPAQGVGEIATCIDSFNATSNKLDQLNQVEKQLQQQKQLAELGELSRAIAHSLRNPLHTLGLTLEQFWQSQDNQLKHSLKTIADNKITHLNKSISALLQLSNQQSSRTHTVPIAAVLQDIQLEIGKLNFELDIKVQQDLFIQGAESEIRAMLHTLLVNAIEAQQANQNTQSIKVNAYSEQNTLFVEVEDQGGGFETHVLTQLFEPHVSSKADGAGMGLYLAKRLAELYYAGDIQVQNTQNGARVTLQLAQSSLEEGAVHD
ncbi:HAMP domain-containing sensor histidine kinase [Pseudoalteromonas sp. BZB3]|uniref:HAMP domain-containing sensor histidine kinase n=1 Tax=Pseudoalteromonas sp. BZB3 TaxID=3136670 RepID=UPI0032C4140A